MGLPPWVAERRGELVQRWTEAVMDAYPSGTGRFLRETQDPFRNPVGATLRETLPVIFDGLCGLSPEEEWERALDRVVRLKAVQDGTATEALAFLLRLKGLLREEARQSGTDAAGRTALEDAVDGLLFRAFEAYVRCRERISEIKVQDANRRAYLLLRRFGTGEEEAAGEAGSGPLTMPTHPERGEGP
jgi:hypothetical protein